MKRITDISEVHEILLQIASEFDRICTKHGIPYYMLYGTMLGAVRHKGFIPWDDDMDFGIPFEYYDLLIEKLTEELPYPYRCLTFESNKNVVYPVCKIDNSETLIDDPRLRCRIEDKLGINIDVFPLIRCKGMSLRIQIVRFLIRMQTLFFLNTTSSSKFHQIIYRVFKVFALFSNKCIPRMIMQVLKGVKSGDMVVSVFGSYGKKELVPLSDFGEGKCYLFENVNLRGVTKAHSYLLKLYDKYLMLPPLHKRKAHVSDVYYR